MSPKGLNSIYTYVDYRDYLKDYYTVRLGLDPAYSHRAMARELGFPSPNHIKLVMDGKQRLGSKSITRLVEGLGLRSRERVYFTNLVSFCQARTAAEKNRLYTLLTTACSPERTTPISSREYEYYDCWYNCIIRELIVRQKPPIDFDRLARCVKPRISSGQAKASVGLLLELGMIKADADGTYSQTSRFLATDREVTSLGIRNYHSHMIELGKQAIDAVSREQREISSMTLCVSEQCMAQIKQRMQEFEDEIFQMVQRDHDARRVYQMNLQFFPVSDEAQAGDAEICTE
jgi:uncharacterized protein (TIGR02147 family)